MLTPAQEKLKEAALAATAGPWVRRFDPGNPAGVQHGVRLPGEFGAWVCDCLDNADKKANAPVAGERNAAFIAAANPAAILAILAQLEQVQGDARRYNLLFNIDNFCQDELWTVVDWMRGGPDDPTKADVDAALDEYAAKQSASGQPLPPPPEAA